ncbi:2541_t:CDS:2, partial [Dentiscutata heterogama]
APQDACLHAIVRDYALKTIPMVFKQSPPDEPRVFAVLTTVEDHISYN